MSFSRPVAYVYDPLAHARDPHERYLARWGAGAKRVLFLGMNPGPFGMVQTGVPFGDVASVRDFLGVEGRVSRPRREHPLRPVLGFACPRSEVSGQRLWGWVERRFESPARFFRDHFVHNYCPLAFLEAGGRNLTPDRLCAADQGPLFTACDAALTEVVQALGSRHVVGVGAFAERRARYALRGAGVTVCGILHPSPASPLANRGWAPTIERQLGEAGLLGPA
ncbi:MAG: single-stranded DNA-binding protein [Polyangiaceae bacterium]|nr:single-stranded DNA-binding protein [Polyangiaceae bacterium]